MDSRGVRGWILVGMLTMAAGCGVDEVWPPAPQDQHEREMIESALRAVSQFDGWNEVACVVEKVSGQWRVQAWRIVNPAAKGRDRCVPWAVRGIKLDNDAKVVAYENHL